MSNKVALYTGALIKDGTVMTPFIGPEFYCVTFFLLIDVVKICKAI